jgi:succinate dehydrogenase/fumarate reductase flavoprotein subunit
MRSWDREADVLIVGTGYAGLSAAIEAYGMGADVLVLDKRHTTGGNSIIATGGVNAADPQRQKAQGIEDSLELHFKHTYEGGNCLGEPEKIRFLVENAREMCLCWLENIGVEWPDKIIMGYGALWPRTHVPPRYNGAKNGAAVVRALLDQLKKRRISILLKHKVTGIFREEPLKGKVMGLEVEHESKKLSFAAKRGVILATGGFAADLGMVMSHDRRLANMPTTNHPEATGECIRTAEDVGADVVHMDYIQCIPKIVGPPSKANFFRITAKETRTSEDWDAYAIFVDKSGTRFVREDARRDEITSAASSLPFFQSVPVAVANTVGELEEKMRIAKDSLVETIRNFNHHCEVGCDEDFGKDHRMLVPLRTPPFRAEAMAMARHHTMGGLKVLGTTCEVVDRWGLVIPCLYAAGEVTGGIHGANRVGYNATADCIIFGRTAGKSAAQNKSWT